MITPNVPSTPVEWAERAAEAIRGLNHASRAGYVWPSDVDATVGELQLLAERLPQALNQTARWLSRQDLAGRVGHDAGDDPTVVVGMVLADLEYAAAQATNLAGLLAAARTNTTHLTGVQP